MNKNKHKVLALLLALSMITPVKSFAEGENVDFNSNIAEENADNIVDESTNEIPENELTDANALISVAEEYIKDIESAIEDSESQIENASTLGEINTSYNYLHSLLYKGFEYNEGNVTYEDFFDTYSNADYKNEISDKKPETKDKETLQEEINLAKNYIEEDSELSLKKAVDELKNSIDSKDADEFEKAFDDVLNILTQNPSDKTRLLPENKVDNTVIAKPDWTKEDKDNKSEKENKETKEDLKSNVKEDLSSEKNSNEENFTEDESSENLDVDNINTEDIPSTNKSKIEKDDLSEIQSEETSSNLEDISNTNVSKKENEKFNLLDFLLNKKSDEELNKPEDPSTQKEISSADNNINKSIEIEVPESENFDDLKPFLDGFTYYISSTSFDSKVYSGEITSGEMYRAINVIAQTLTQSKDNIGASPFLNEKDQTKLTKNQIYYYYDFINLSREYYKRLQSARNDYFNYKFENEKADKAKIKELYDAFVKVWNENPYEDFIITEDYIKSYKEEPKLPEIPETSNMDLWDELDFWTHCFGEFFGESENKYDNTTYYIFKTEFDNMVRKRSVTVGQMHHAMNNVYATLTQSYTNRKPKNLGLDETDKSPLTENQVSFYLDFIDISRKYIQELYKMRDDYENWKPKNLNADRKTLQNYLADVTALWDKDPYKDFNFNSEGVYKRASNNVKTGVQGNLKYIILVLIVAILAFFGLKKFSKKDEDNENKK
ncbi:MAG: hypothetical protein SOZ89_01715 [Peptoniphilaceae bacterium]|nr:hypothetical protein [Peptoniphilaceae bacterium]MDD7383647.1 hypothetical protein [Peptoniphilaceae bacterium]MDY3737818.1 hypothetical protein [Peptoniphilaceae bacterium]